ncbi:MAG: hypothetical protein AB1403_02245 [Candidatus Riflebacteria bacterium]
MKNIKLLLLISILLLPIQGFAAGNPASRGVITIDGVPGMFINPTSGTLQKGEISLHACISDQDWVGDDSYWKGIFLGYGVSDRFELGFSHSGFDNRTDDKAVDASGPAFRYRFLDEDVSGWEGSIGAYHRPGTKYVARTGGNIAFSKKIGEAGLNKEIRLHLGARTFKQDGWWIGKWLGAKKNSLANDSASLVYGGIEVQLQKNLYAIGEVSSTGGYYIKTPWAVGLQYKSGGFGCSLGAVQPGYAGHPGYFFGIGINFD